MDNFLMLLTVSVFGIVLSVTGVQQTFHSSLTQKASVGCSGGENITLTFFLDKGTDAIGAIYLVNPNDTSYNTQATFSLLTGDVTGSGSNPDPYKFSVMTEMNGQGELGLSPSSINATSEIVRAESLTVHVIIKSNNSFTASPFMESVIFPDDVMYVASCQAKDLMGTIVSTGQINATGIIEETRTPLQARAFFYILGPNFDVINSAAIGETITLFIEPSSRRTVYVYAHSCFVCVNDDCASALSVELIDSQGCSTGYVPSMMPTGDVILTEFKMFKLIGADMMFFRCRVGFCESHTDPKCLDFCAFNTGQTSIAERQRRDVPANKDEVVVSTYLRVTGGSVDVDDLDPLLSRNQAANAKQLQQNTALLGTVIALAIVLFVGLAVAIVMFRRLSSTT